MTSNSHSENYYQQNLEYHLQCQCDKLQSIKIDHASALQILQYYDSAIVPLNGQLRYHSSNTKQQFASQTFKHPSGRIIKLKIVRLCRRAVICHKKNDIDKALKLLELGLDLSETLAEHNYYNSQYYAALVLSMMGRLYLAKRYYLFALASFQASLEAYRSLTYDAVINAPIQNRMAVVLCEIAHIAQVTNHPDIAIEHYLEALWHFNQLGNKVRMHQIVQHLDQLFRLAKTLSPDIAQQ